VALSDPISGGYHVTAYEKLQKQVDELQKQVDDLATLIADQSKTTQPQDGVIRQLIERQAQLRVDVNRLSAEVEDMTGLEPRIEGLESTTAKLNLAALAGLPPSAWDEVERVLTPQEPPKEPVRLQAPDPRRGSLTLEDHVEMRSIQSIGDE
jgi:hypothetical protein